MNSLIVAFTPKGGCLLKPRARAAGVVQNAMGSIHPQGWVPIETEALHRMEVNIWRVAFTPKGGCPLKPYRKAAKLEQYYGSIHPQGWVPIETGSTANAIAAST